MKLGSCCTGIGGLDLGFELAGWSVAWQIERDETKRRILEKHWPDVRRERDMGSVAVHSLEPVDCLAIGIPTWTPEDTPIVLEAYLRIADAMAPPILLIEMPPPFVADFASNGDLIGIHEFSHRRYLTTQVHTQIIGSAVSGPFSHKSSWLIGHRVTRDPFPNARGHAVLNVSRTGEPPKNMPRNYGAIVDGHVDIGEADWGFWRCWTYVPGITTEARKNAVLEATPVPAAHALAAQLAPVVSETLADVVTA